MQTLQCVLNGTMCVSIGRAFTAGIRLMLASACVGKRPVTVAGNMGMSQT